MCLTRVPIDDANDTVFLCTGKENNLHQHKEVPDEEVMDFKSHQYFFSACYLFHDTLFIGGKSTEGLIIDWPSLEVNRFEIVKQDGELNIVDRKAQKQSPQLKIECC